MGLSAVWGGVEPVGVRLRMSDAEHHLDWYGDAVTFPHIYDTARGALRCCRCGGPWQQGDADEDGDGCPVALRARIEELEAVMDAARGVHGAHGYGADTTEPFRALGDALAKLEAAERGEEESP